MASEPDDATRRGHQTSGSQKAKSGPFMVVTPPGEGASSGLSAWVLLKSAQHRTAPQERAAHCAQSVPDSRGVDEKRMMEADRGGTDLQLQNTPVNRAVDAQGLFHREAR